MVTLREAMDIHRSDDHVVRLGNHYMFAAVIAFCEYHPTSETDCRVVIPAVGYLPQRLSPEMAPLRRPTMSAELSLLEAKRTCSRNRKSDVHDPAQTSFLACTRARAGPSRSILQSS